jgi:hypothetical protein
MHTNWGFYVRERSSMSHDKTTVMSIHEANIMEVWRDSFHNSWESWNMVKYEQSYSKKECYDKNISQDDKRSILKSV